MNQKVGLGDRTLGKVHPMQETRPCFWIPESCKSCVVWCTCHPSAGQWKQEDAGDWLASRSSLKLSERPCSKRVKREQKRTTSNNNLRLAHVCKHKNMHTCADNTHTHTQAKRRPGSWEEYLSFSASWSWTQCDALCTAAPEKREITGPWGKCPATQWHPGPSHRAFKFLLTLLGSTLSLETSIFLVFLIQAGLEVPTWPRIALNSQSSLLTLNIEIVVVNDTTRRPNSKQKF